MWLAEGVQILTFISHFSQAKLCSAGLGKAITWGGFCILRLVTGGNLSTFLQMADGVQESYQAPLPSFQSPVLMASTTEKSGSLLMLYIQGGQALLVSKNIKMKPLSRELEDVFQPDTFL